MKMDRRNGLRVPATSRRLRGGRGLTLRKVLFLYIICCCVSFIYYYCLSD